MGQAPGGVLCCGALVSASQAPASEELELDALVEVESAPRGFGPEGWQLRHMRAPGGARSVLTWACWPNLKPQ